MLSWMLLYDHFEDIVSHTILNGVLRWEVVGTNLDLCPDLQTQIQLCAPTERKCRNRESAEFHLQIIGCWF
jgi:hypothetical protein